MEKTRLMLSVTRTAGSVVQHFGVESGRLPYLTDMSLIEQFQKECARVSDKAKGYQDVVITGSEMSCTLHGVKFNYKLKRIAV